MNIAIILGAHNGSCVSILESLVLPNHKDPIKWDLIHLWEPQSLFKERLQKLENDQIIYHQKVAWNENKEDWFFIKGTPSLGHVSSSVYKDKRGENISEELCEFVDFNEWLNQNTKESDFIFLDMDIECSENVILPRLIFSNLVSRIRYLSVEFHINKSPYWKIGELDKGIMNFTKEFFREKLIDHTTIF